MSEPNTRAIVGHTTDESRPHWPTPASAPAGAPNVVYLVFDDLGFADLEIGRAHV